MKRRDFLGGLFLIPALAVLPKLPLPTTYQTDGKLLDGKISSGFISGGVVPYEEIERLFESSKTLFKQPDEVVYFNGLEDFITTGHRDSVPIMTCGDINSVLVDYKTGTWLSDDDGLTWQLQS